MCVKTMIPFLQIVTAHQMKSRAVVLELNVPCYVKSVHPNGKYIMTSTGWANVLMICVSVQLQLVSRVWLPTVQIYSRTTAQTTKLFVVTFILETNEHTVELILPILERVRVLYKNAMKQNPWVSV